MVNVSEPSEPRGRRTLSSAEMDHRQVLATIVGVVVVLVVAIGGMTWGCDRSDTRDDRTKQACIEAGGTWAYGGQCLIADGGISGDR